MKRAAIVIALAVFAAAVATAAMPVAAAACVGGGRNSAGFVAVNLTCHSPDGSQPSWGASQTSSDASRRDPFVSYRWRIACFGGPEAVDAECLAAQTCSDPLERRFRLWGQTRAGEWQTLTEGCFGGTPEEYVPPEVTPGNVLSALRRVGLPSLTVQTQPADETLVNFDTIFFVEPEAVSVDLTILGQAVDVLATPAGYQWSFGDGAGMSSSSPGAPYPSTEITHRYSDAHVTMQPSVTVSYTARFRVGGGAWQDIDGTVTSPGPGTSLLISEATPLLSGGRG